MEIVLSDIQTNNCGATQTEVVHVIQNICGIKMDVNDAVLRMWMVSSALIVAMKIVCFVLGYLTIRLGYLLIASGAKGEFKFSASVGNYRGDLVSVSPGLLFVLLGVILIGYAMYVEKSVEIDPFKKEAGALELPVPDATQYENQNRVLEASRNSTENVQDVEVKTDNVEDIEDVEANAKNKKE